MASSSRNITMESDGRRKRGPYREYLRDTNKMPRRMRMELVENLLTEEGEAASSPARAVDSQCLSVCQDGVDVRPSELDFWLEVDTSIGDQGLTAVRIVHTHTHTHTFIHTYAYLMYF